MLPTMFRFIWPYGFSEEDFLEINQSETRIACGGHINERIGDEMSNLCRGPSMDDSYQVSVHLVKRFQGRRFFFKSANQKQELPVVAIFVKGSGQNEQSL